MEMEVVYAGAGGHQERRAGGRTLLPMEAAASSDRRGRPKEERELKKRQ